LRRAVGSTSRRAARETEILQRVLRAFVKRAGPAEVEQIVAAFADGPPDGLRADLARLDADDLIQIRDGLVDVARTGAASLAFRVWGVKDG
jgi:hypothetical protein